MRVFLADANKDVRIALQMLFNRHPDMDVIGIAVRSDSLVEQVVAARPDVLLVNWDLPGHFLPDQIARLRALIPRLRLVVLGVRFEASSMAMEAGVDAFVDMNAPPQELVDVLREVGAPESR